jgi:hypothetical protein
MRLWARAAEAERIEDGEVVSRVKAWVRGRRVVMSVAIEDINIVAGSVEDYSFGQRCSREVVVGSKRKRCCRLTTGKRLVAFVCSTANTNPNSVGDAASRVSRTN